MRAQARRAVVLAAVRERRAVERGDRLAIRRGEREMEPGTRGELRFALQLDRELVFAVAHAVADRAPRFPDAEITERCEDSVVERRRALEVGDAERNVVQHYFRGTVRPGTSGAMSFTSNCTVFE